MNILMLSTDRAIFEKDSPVRARLREQAELAGKLHVIILGPKGLGKAEEKVNKHLIIHGTESAFRFFYMSDAYRIGRRIILGHKGSWIVTAQDPFWAGPIAFLLSRVSGAAFHLQLHTDIFSHGWHGSLIRKLLHPLVFFRDVNELRALLEQLLYPMALFLLRHADGVRVISERLFFGVRSIGVPTERITKVPIFAEMGHFFVAKPSFDLHRSYPGFPRIVLSLGRLQPEKNYRGLIRAFALVAKEHDDTLLLIVGSGPERERLLALTRSLLLDDRVKILPWARDVATYYKTCDVYVQSSDYEGWGLAVIEAMASGAPVVMTDVGCAGEVVLSERTGLVVPVGDEKALAQAIARLLDNRELARTLAANGALAVKKLATKAETLMLYKSSWAQSFATMNDRPTRQARI
jgi:glycosyltransferase involved in cell wall biosynthesis